MSPRTPITVTSVHNIRSIRPFNSLGSKDVDETRRMITAILIATESSSCSAPRLDVPPTVYVPKVSDLRQSKSLVLQGSHCDKRICDNLKGDRLRKYELHCGSRSNEDVAGSDSTRPHLSGLRSRRALRLYAASLYRHITSVRPNRRKRNTQWRGSSPWP